MSALTWTALGLLGAALVGVHMLARDARRAVRDESLGVAPDQTARAGHALTRAIKRAGWNVTVPELLIVWMLATSAGALGATALGWGAVGALACAGAGAALVPLALLLAVRRARGDLEEQFGEAMPLIAADINAGQTLPDALRSVSSEAEEPLRNHIQRVFARVEAGMAFDQALQLMAQETKSLDVQILASTVQIQQEHGGSVGRVIDQIGQTIADRAELRRMVRARSASMTLTVRIITGVVGCMVLASALLLDQGREFYAQPVGWVSAGVIAALLVCANVVTARLRDAVL